MLPSPVAVHAELGDGHWPDMGLALWSLERAMEGTRKTRVGENRVLGFLQASWRTQTELRAGG